MSRQRKLLGSALAIALAGAATGSPTAAELDLEGEVWLDGRVFFQAPQWNDQSDRRVQPSIALTGAMTLNFDGGQDTLRLVPFGRLDPTVSARSHFDIREAYYLHKDDGWDVLIGANRVFWGVTESRHLVNIVNQTDQLEDVDNEEFLGQPMLNVSLFGEWGTLDLFAMTGFRERQFPDQSGRYSLPISISESDARFESDLEIWQPDLAVRYRTTVDNWDFGLSHFYGTSREPRFGLVLDDAAAFLPPAVQAQIEALTLASLGDLEDVESVLSGSGVSAADALGFADQFVSLAPIYDVINQTSIEILGVYDDLLLKFEGMTRTGHGGDRIWAAVGGFEYTFTDFAATGMDVGLLGEYLYDSREIEDGPYTPFDNDIFGGLRVAFNDLDTTSLLLGGYVDLDLGSTILTAELESRIYDNVTLSLEARGFPYVSQEDPMRVFEKDSYVQVRFNFYF